MFDMRYEMGTKRNNYQLCQTADNYLKVCTVLPKEEKIPQL